MITPRIAPFIPQAHCYACHMVRPKQHPCRPGLLRRIWRWLWRRA